MNRRVVQQPAILASPPCRQAVADAERHFDDGAVVGDCRELLVHGWPVERREWNRRVQIVERE
jgi:hypothetical protein